jgi:hypothetical protein
MRPDLEEKPPSAESVMAMLAFSAASSSLLLINKLCLHLIPAPSLISSLQFVFCVVFIAGLKMTGTAVVDDFEWAKLKPYVNYTIMFVATIYCNMKVHT